MKRYSQSRNNFISAIVQIGVAVYDPKIQHLSDFASKVVWHCNSFVLNGLVELRE